MTKVDKVNQRLTEPDSSISPSHVVQLLKGCPLMYRLNKDHPEQPSSLEHALGIAYHAAQMKMFNVTYSSLETFLYLNPRVSIKALLNLLGDADLFSHGIAYRNNWEKDLLKDVFRRMLTALWHRGEIVSARQMAEKYAKEGTEVVFWANEHKPPRVTLAWILEGLGFTEIPNYNVVVVPDRLLLLKKQGVSSLIIIDHKIPGVDTDPTLGGGDYKLQMAIYALWASRAFKGVVDVNQIFLEAHIFDLHLLKLTKVSLQFNESVRQKTAEMLIKAINALENYKANSFPANVGRKCQNCDFAFAKDKCTHSAANPNIWALDANYEPLDYPTKAAKKEQVTQPPLF